MKTAFIIACAILLPIWSAYFLVDYIHEEAQAEPEWKRVTVEPVERQYCSTWTQGFKKIQSCNF